MKTRRLCAGLALGLGMLGCENEGDAQQDCATFARVFCEKVVSCAESGSLIAAGDSAASLYADCETETKNSARCDQVVRVAPSYDKCVEDSKNLDCATVGPALAMNKLPAPMSCTAFVVYSDN